MKARRSVPVVQQWKRTRWPAFKPLPPDLEAVKMGLIERRTVGPVATATR